MAGIQLNVRKWKVKRTDLNISGVYSSLKETNLEQGKVKYSCEMLVNNRVRNWRIDSSVKTRGCSSSGP